MAAEEFARSGFHGTSYNQLLRRLQLGKSSAYYYFADKRDLFLTALQHCYLSYFDAMKQLARPASAAVFWQYILEATRIGYTIMLEDPTSGHMLQCMQRERALLGELVSTELLASIDGFYRDVIGRGQRLGAVRVDLPQELLVSVVRDMAMSFDRWFIVGRDGPSAIDPDEAARLFTAMARRLCEPR